MNLYKSVQSIFKKYRNIDENCIDYENVKAILKNDKKAILIDVRSPQEYKEGHLMQSINFPLYDFKVTYSIIYLLLSLLFFQFASLSYNPFYLYHLLLIFSITSRNF